MANATVIITTKNRKSDLCKAIASALSQTIPLQVLVIDDGSTDGTYDLVRQEFPNIEIHRSEISQGLIVQRNRAARFAQTPILISIDDDAIFSKPDVVATILGEFNHPRVGAVAIPVIDVNRSPEVHHQAPEARGLYAIYDYVGTAHALRRDIFLNLGGYRELLTHQGEEEDYCIRLLGSGYITRAGSSKPIHHFESPRRSFARMDYYGARNKVLYVWHNVPRRNLPVRLAGTTANMLIYSLKPTRFLTRLRGVMAAYAMILSGKAIRQPVGPECYQTSQQLKKSGPILLAEIEEQLPMLSTPEPSLTGKPLR